MNVLPVDNTPANRLLVSQDGTPVWPVKDASELYALQQLVSVFGSRLELTKGSHGKLAFTGVEEVVALGEGVIDNAHLYAHLTQRRFRTASSLNVLTTFEQPAVVITTTDWLTIDLMNILYPGKSNVPATGIIFADTPEQLHLQVLIRSAAALLCGPLKTQRIDIFPQIPICQQINPDGWLVLGGSAPSRAIKEVLEHGAGILTILTHADGIDASLGPNLVLCSMDRSPLTADKKRSPRCRVTGICHRLETSVEVALSSGNLIHPESIRARVCFIEGCRTLRLKSSLIDFAWGLIPRLLASPTIGAILVSWEVVFTSPHHVGRLPTDISHGLCVGQALTKFHYSDEAKGLDRRICLLGDPRVHLFPQKPDKLILPQVKDCSISDKIVRPHDIAELEKLTFLRAFLVEQIPCLTGELLNICRGLLILIETYELLAWKGVGDALESGKLAPGPLMRHMLVKFLLKRGRLLWNYWLHLSYSAGAVLSNRLCFSCGMRVKIVEAHLRIPGSSSRRLTTCVQCGLIEDCPIDFPYYEISVPKIGVVRLSGSLPRDRWAAGIMLDPSLPSALKGWEWPTDEIGSPVKVFQTPEAWPEGPLRIAVFFIWKGDLAVIGTDVGSLEKL